ncbi:hypothetical protein ARTHRO9V_210053 [Arthrobacter sp. 9V]|nr:hypothetical protein ARTHRO9V_210053 [Arthrobacter sp. 9V]
MNELREVLQPGLTVLASLLYEILCPGETTCGKDHPSGVSAVSRALPLPQPGAVVAGKSADWFSQPAL